jgi:hypothetical protein
MAKIKEEIYPKAGAKKVDCGRMLVSTRSGAR